MKRIVKNMTLSKNKAKDIRRVLFEFSNACIGHAYAVDKENRILTDYEDWSFSPQGINFIKGMNEEVLFQYSLEWGAIRISYNEVVDFGEILGELEIPQVQEFTIFRSPFEE